MIWVCARRTWSSLHPRLSRNGAICNWRMAWYDIHSAPTSRTSLLRMLFRSISCMSLPFLESLFILFLDQHIDALFGNHPIVKLFNIADHRGVIGVRKFKQRALVIGYFGCKYLLDQVQLVGGKFIEITSIQNSPVANPVNVVAIALN